MGLQYGEGRGRGERIANEDADRPRRREYEHRSETGRENEMKREGSRIAAEQTMALFRAFDRGGLISNSKGNFTLVSHRFRLSVPTLQIRTEHNNTAKVDSKEREVPSSGISRPLADVLRELNWRVLDKLIKTRIEDEFSTKYVPWHIINRIMNLHAPEWSGEVRSITYSNDGKTISVVYRITIYGTNAEIYRKSIGTTSMNDTSFRDPVQKAEAMAFHRACSRFGLGL